MKSQMQMYRESASRLAEANAAFMDMVNHPTNPMTRNDLEALIRRRPEKYSRFSVFLDILPFTED